MEQCRLCLLLVLTCTHGCSKFCKAGIVGSGGAIRGGHGVVTPCQGCWAKAAKAAKAAGVTGSFFSCQLLSPVGLILLFPLCISPFVPLYTFLDLLFGVKRHLVMVEIGGCK